MVTSVGSTAVSLTVTVPTRWTANGCATAPLIVSWPSKVSVTAVAGVLVSSGTGRGVVTAGRRAENRGQRGGGQDHSCHVPRSY